MNEGSMCQSNPMHAREAGRPAPWRFGVGAHACMVMVRPSGRPVLLLLLLRPAPAAYAMEPAALLASRREEEASLA